MNLSIIATLLLLSGIVFSHAQEDGKDEQPKKAKVIKLSETRYKIGKIEIDKKARTVKFPAAMNMERGLLEYALVTEMGKLHESLLYTKISPLNLNVALLLLSYQPSGNYFPARVDGQGAAQGPDSEQKKAPPKKPTFDDKNSFSIRLDWKDEEGKKQTAQLEEWIYHNEKKEKAAAGAWVYTGAFLDRYGNFAAEIDGSIVAIYNDRRALINSPRAGSRSDEIWEPMEGLPPMGTPVILTFSPFKP